MSENIDINQKDFELIEQYVLGTLHPDEVIEFEKRLINNLYLQQQVKEYRILIDGVEQQSLLNKLNDFHKEITPDKTIDKKAVKKNSITRFSIAASLALIVALGGIWIYRTSNSNQKLYAKYFTPDPGLPTLMSIEDDFEFNEAMVNYKRGEYQMAIEKWEALLVEKPLNDTINYFLGVAYLAEKNQHKTIEFLTIVAGESKSIFFKDANFYLGLAYLRNKDIEKSIQSFKTSNNEKSQQILDNLNCKK